MHDQGLVTLLLEIHDDIDRVTYAAYGWSDLWQWQENASTGQVYDPESDTETFFELDRHTSIYELTREAREQYEQYEQILLQRLVDLNHERAAEEARGKIRYLRPDFQDPEGTQKSAAAEQKLALPASEIKAAALKAEKRKWPKTLPAQIVSLRELIPTLGADAAQLSTAYGRASKKRQSDIQEILGSLKLLGHL